MIKFTERYGVSELDVEQIVTCNRGIPVFKGHKSIEIKRIRVTNKNTGVKKKTQKKNHANIHKTN